MMLADDIAQLEFFGIVLGAIFFVGLAWEIFHRRH